MVGVVLDRVVWRAGDRAILNGLSASLSPRGITALVGPNGAGKSVALRLIDGLLAPQAGTIRFTGETEAPRRAFVFQTPALIRASVADNVALALKPLTPSRAETRARVSAALARVGLLDRSADPARKLSGGERQRLALARAMVIEPQLLLLDEPTASLDPGATQMIEAILADLARAGTKVLLVSHHLGQVARLASDVLVIAAGRAVEYGPAASLLAHPRSAEARAYLHGELPWTPFAAVS